MSKPRVTFKMQRIAEDDWQILADYPGAETRYIKGLKSKAEVDEWLNGTRRIDWLRSHEAVTVLRIEPFHRGIWKPMGI